MSIIETRASVCGTTVAHMLKTSSWSDLQSPFTLKCWNAEPLLEHGPSFSFPKTRCWPGVDPVLTRWTERKSEHVSGEHDGSDYPFFSLLVVGGQEWMSLIEISAISLALTLARCLSFVQNGAEAGEYSSCRVETSHVCVLSHGAVWVCPQESTTFKTGIWALLCILSL